MNETLKKIIFNKLYEDLAHVEIIPHEKSIWFIDREKKYWYLEFKNHGILYFRYQFFMDFFYLFSMERDEFQPIIIEWVEEVLNSKVNTTRYQYAGLHAAVEEVLNYKVNTTICPVGALTDKVEEVLNYKVNTTESLSSDFHCEVEEALNHTVGTTAPL